MATTPFSEEKYKTVPLYGGAFSITIPATFIDISQFRQVPNHQEVFMDDKNDRSVIVEVNEYVNAPNDEACSHFYQELIQDDKATNATDRVTGTLSYQDVPGVPSNVVDYISYVNGSCTSAKFNESAENRIRTYMMNLRMKQISTDLLVIINIPMVISSASSASGASIMTNEEADNLIKKIASSFKINNLSIFGL